ncbi:hypothetical protein [Demequina litorisediminis]|uniref:hypothetical protein n=1 Tax=Demequina litorisediminis TaxID=1849022 RepID=UPI0024E087CB|nr:hypothetical protein [Demequina litorisediminis]
MRRRVHVALADGSPTGSGKGCAIASDVRARIKDNPGSGACSFLKSITADNRDTLISQANYYQKPWEHQDGGDAGERDSGQGRVLRLPGVLVANDNFSRRAYGVGEFAAPRVPLWIALPAPCVRGGDPMSPVTSNSR